MPQNAQQLPGSLGAHLLETYYRTLDDALAMAPRRKDRRQEEIGDVLPRPAARLRVASELQRPRS